MKGSPASRSGRIEAPIGRDRDRPDAALARHADAARRRDAVRGRGAARPRTRCCDVTLETGRTHQIRVHLEAIELPVSGDPVYGVSGDLGLERQFLHAARLAFDHPITSERIDVESPLPEDLAAALERARGWLALGLSAATLPVVFPSSRRPGRVGVPGLSPVPSAPRRL